MTDRPLKQIHLAAHFPGVNNTTVWSDPASGSHIEFASFRHLAQTAERGKFDFFFLAEGLRLRESKGRIHDLDVVGRPESITVLNLSYNSAASPPWTTSPAAARPGTWSPPRTPSPGRTSAAAATWTAPTATPGPPNSSSWHGSSGTPGRTAYGTAARSSTSRAGSRCPARRRATRW